MRDPPVPIPNTEVKPHRAESTWRATAWQDRSSPGFFMSIMPALLLCRSAGVYWFIVENFRGNQKTGGRNKCNRPFF